MRAPVQFELWRFRFIGPERQERVVSVIRRLFESRYDLDKFANYARDIAARLPPSTNPTATSLVEMTMVGTVWGESGRYKAP